MQLNLGTYLLLVGLAGLSAILTCCSSEHAKDAREQYFDEKNKMHNGDYLATYPLHSPDSCMMRLKDEVPAPYQPYSCMGIWYRMPHTNLDSSFRLLELYERYYPHDTVHTFAQLKRAEFHVEAARFPEADSCLRDVEQISLRLNRTLDLSDVYFLRGRIEMYRNNFSESRQALFKYLELLDSHDTTFSQAHALAYHSIAITYERAQQHDNMRTWLNKLWSALEHQPGEPWVYQLKAQTAILNGIGYLGTQPDSSLLWAQKAERIIKKDLQLNTPARLHYLFGRAYIELKRCGTALPYLLDAYRRRPGSHEAFGYYQYPHALGHAYLCAGRLDSAEIFLREALPSPDTGNLAATHRWLGEIAAQKGDYQRAWDYQKTSAELLKAKFTTDRINAAAETDARYEALEQSKRVVVLEKERQINRFKMMLLALLLNLLVGTATAFYYFQRRRQKILQNQNQLLKQEKQLAELHAHFKAQELEVSQVELRQTKDELQEAAILLNLKNQLIETLELRLQQHPALQQPNALENGKAADQFGEMRILTKDDWEVFLEKFSSQFPAFLVKLQSQFPELTSAEIRLLLLIKIGFNTQQIAEMLGIAANSIWRSRHRLVKSLGLDTARQLDAFIQAY